MAGEGAGETLMSETWNRRDLLKTGGALGAGLSLAPLAAWAEESGQDAKPLFEISLAQWFAGDGSNKSSAGIQQPAHQFSDEILSGKKQCPLRLYRRAACDMDAETFDAHDVPTRGSMIGTKCAVVVNELIDLTGVVLTCDSSGSTRTMS